MLRDKTKVLALDGIFHISILRTCILTCLYKRENIPHKDITQLIRDGTWVS